jgi:hypothetical protein
MILLLVQTSLLILVVVILVPGIPRSLIRRCLLMIKEIDSIISEILDDLFSSLCEVLSDEEVLGDV